MIKIEIPDEKWKEIEEKHLRFVKKHILSSIRGVQEIEFSDQIVKKRIQDIVLHNGLDLKKEVFLTKDMEKYAFTAMELYTDDFLKNSFPKDCMTDKGVNEKRRYCVNVVLNGLGYSNKFSKKDGLGIGENERCGRHEYLNMLDVHVCPYCNRQYITSFEKKDKKWSTADMDHYYPKAIFPLLSMNLYNMIPSCAICNSRLKLNKVKEREQIHLHPYTDSSNCVRFAVKLDTFDALYRIEKKDMQIELMQIQEQKKSKNSLNIFKLKEIYKEHTDCAYEIVSKMNTYSEKEYNRIFNKDYPNIFSSYEELEHCMFDFLEKDYLDAPLVKMKKDIYKQIKSLSK